MSPLRRFGSAVLIVAALPGLAWYAWPRGGNGLGPGMVRTTEIRIAPEVSGRVAQFLVAPGDRVKAGQPVASIVSPELFAAVDAAQAAVEKARADRDRVYAGVRAEEVQALAQDIVKAQAVHEHDAMELQRKTQLAARSFASQQDLDVARAAEAVSLASIASAQAHYAEAQHGPTVEERALADAMVAAAEAGRDVVQARAAKMLLRASANGVVGTLVAEPGEAVIAGQPLLTMAGDGGTWFGFTVREDRLGELAVGTVIKVEIAPGQFLPAKIVELRNWGEFAVWRAATAVGDHDLNTFFLRADPAASTSDFAPGQTVWIARQSK